MARDIRIGVEIPEYTAINIIKRVEISDYS